MLNEHLHFPVAVTISLMSPAKVSLLFPCRRDLPYLPPVDIPYYHLQSEGVSLSISLRHIDPGLISSGPFSMIEPTNSAPLSDDTTQWLNHMFFFSPSIRSFRQIYSSELHLDISRYLLGKLDLKACAISVAPPWQSNRQGKY